ncbi:translation initiation factor IF-2 [Amycolatopsis antarctica]|uniref:Translation initiation factor IF-2 n=1 Tax=Amycolatopsis antarctica TaxID=1854586 RepID=A0A263CZ74_9PSEU|nr:translation initiation factor IF-2 [Amycolatopsis antarctica]
MRTLLRSLCDRHGVPVESRARLVLSVLTVARPCLDDGGTATLTASVVMPAGAVADPVRDAIAEPAADPDGDPAEPRPLLVVGLRPCTDMPVPADTELPLPAVTGEDGDLVWRLPLPGPPARDGTGPDDRGGPEEAELRAVLARSDVLDRDQRALKHELAETNRGVLAMYVQLEERDEQLRRAHAVIFRELEDALRPPPPSVDGVELAVHYAPAGVDTPVGGDLYDWLVLPDGTVHITIVDAVGHGVTSTRTALAVAHTVRTLALEGHPLPELVGHAARTLARITPAHMATVLLARFCPRTGLLQLANGSHPPALITDAAGIGDFARIRGRGIGFPSPGSAEVESRTLRPGDLALLYTDGLTESRKDLDEGERRLLAATRRHAAMDTARLPASIVEEMHTEVLHQDDTLLLALRYTGPPA